MFSQRHGSNPGNAGIDPTGAGKAALVLLSDTENRRQTG